MVVEKQHSPTLMGTDAMRHDALQVRIQSQEWAGDAVTELMQALAKLHTLPPTTPQQDYQSQLSLILVHLDRFAAAAQTTSIFSKVTTEERNQISLDITQGQQQNLQEQQEVQRLREKLEREKKQVDRRAQYHALAKLILDCPSCENSQKELQDAQKQEKNVAEQMKHLEDTKQTLRKELLVLAHCAAGLEDSTKTLTALVSDQPNRPTNNSEAMDTSM